MPNKYLDSVGLAEYTTLIKTALDDKADLASPALTGTPTAPTPTAGDDSTKIATTAFVNTKAGNYLPLSGGTITGNVYTGGDISRTADNSRLSLNGGNGIDSGAYLNLYGKSHSTYAGLFSLSAYDGTTKKQLQGKIDGTLTWDGNNIALAKDYLPLSGGTMTGNIRSSSDDMFVLRKNDNLYGIQLWSGTSYNNGASISLYGKGYSQVGVFNIGAYGENISSLLHGEPNGTLTWGGKNIERINASGSNYIRFESGLQICWGNNISFNTSGTAINLPVAFKDATYGFVPVGRGLSTSTNCAIAKLTAKTTTAFTVVAVATSNLSSFTSGTIDYVAIGKWK